MATTSEASRLHYGVSAMRFTWIIVGLLALLGLSACGVGGPDDVEGQQAVAGTTSGAAEQNQQALATGPEGCPPPSGDDVPGVTGTGPTNPGVSSLPTDPVPWHGPNPVAGVDPMAAPVGNPVVPIPGPGGMPVK